MMIVGSIQCTDPSGTCTVLYNLLCRLLFQIYLPSQLNYNTSEIKNADCLFVFANAIMQESMNVAGVRYGHEMKKEFAQRGKRMSS